MKKLKKAQKLSILGPQNLGSGEAGLPESTLDLCLKLGIFNAISCIYSFTWFFLQQCWQVSYIMLRVYHFLSYGKGKPMKK